MVRSASMCVALVLVGVWGVARAADEPAPGSTVLNADFARALDLSQIAWPSVAEQDAARGYSTDYARLDTVRWLTALLARPHLPFPVDPGPARMVRDPTGTMRPQSLYATPAAVRYRESVGAAVSAEGKDQTCARWATTEYRFQLIAEAGLMRLSVEPVQPVAREVLTAEQTTGRVRAFLGQFIDDSARVLNFCEWDAAAAPYGWRVAARFTDVMAWHRQFDGEEPGACYHEWALNLVVHTDGVSFVLDVPPVSAGSVVRHKGDHVIERWFTTSRPATGSHTDTQPVAPPPSTQPAATQPSTQPAAPQPATPPPGVP